MSALEMSRRQWLRWAGVVAGASAGCRRPPPAIEEQPADAPLRFPGKVPMRALNDRPPCLETPWQYFRQDLTPIEAFYVRWHLQVIPTVVDTRRWRLRIGGAVERSLELSLAELRRLPATSVVAVNQCSGNSRGLFSPPIAGGQWGNGAMGNARWTGVRLRDVLDRAGVKAKAVEVSFQGLDRGGAPGVPDYVKSLPTDKARDPDLLLAYEMNGEPLPLLNGFPLRLVVPGWYATYWMKALAEITVLTKPFAGFWMNPAYRIPSGPSPFELPGALAKATVPINRMNVRSFFSSPAPGSRVTLHAAVELEGFAFDGGSGIREVAVSDDGGKNWKPASLGDDLGNFSFRRWRMPWTPTRPGEARLLVRATSKSGETQPDAAGWNRSGYMRNVVESLSLDVG